MLSSCSDGNNFLPFVDDDPLFWGCMSFLCSVSFDSLSDAQKRSICTDETYDNHDERENVFKVLDNKVDLLFTQVSSVLNKVDYISPLAIKLPAADA